VDRRTPAVLLHDRAHAYPEPCDFNKKETGDENEHGVGRFAGFLIDLTASAWAVDMEAMKKKAEDAGCHEKCGRHEERRDEAEGRRHGHVAPWMDSFRSMPARL
jgi:hypothetical protein